MAPPAGRSGLARGGRHSTAPPIASEHQQACTAAHPAAADTTKNLMWRLHNGETPTVSSHVHTVAGIREGRRLASGWPTTALNS